MTENVAQPSARSAELLLIQVGADAALVFGPDAPSWLDVRPIVGATSADEKNLTEAAALAVGSQPPGLAAACVVDLSWNALIDLDRNAFLFVLDDELVVTREKALFNDHRVDHRIALQEVRYFRAYAASRKVGIATKNDSLSLTWASDALAEDVAYANDLLRSLKHLPAGEIPIRPLPPSVAGLPGLTTELLRELDEDETGATARD